MVLPVQIPNLHTISVYFDHNTPWLLEFGDPIPVPNNGADGRRKMDHSSVLLALPFSHRWKAENRQQVARFIARNAPLSLEQIGAETFTPKHAEATDLPYLVRDQAGCPYTYDDILTSKPNLDTVQRPFYGFEEAPADVPYLVLKKWSRRADFLHRPQSDPSKEQASLKPYSRVYPAPWAKVDTIRFSYAQFGALIPAILHLLEVSLIAEELANSLLRHLAISDHSLILAAISARSAAEATNYERLEFLGDSILKVCATMNVAAIRKFALFFFFFILPTFSTF
jgi:hypothetical protein